MNRTKDAILLTLAMVMTALVLSVLAPSTGAMISVSKETVPVGAEYKIGDPIEYSIRFENPGAYNATVDIWDVLPNGTRIDYPWPNPSQNPVYLSANSEVKWWNFKTTVADDWHPDNYGLITNTVRVHGFYDNPLYPEMINHISTRSSKLIYEPPEVPVLTPLGMITLLGLLLGIAVIALRKRQ